MKKNYEEALEKALEIQEKDDQKSLISLGKYLEKAFENQQQALIKYVGEDEKARRVMKLFYEGYYEAKSHPKANNILVEFTHLKSILDNYTQVIKNISIKCAERESMSLAAYKMLLPFELTHDLVERDKIMTQLFQFSFEANFHESAFKYFNKLCCKEEKDFFSFEIKPQASTLIATAKEHKRKLKEIERLEEKLDEKQTLIETLKRQLDAEKSVSTIHPAAC